MNKGTRVGVGYRAVIVPRSSLAPLVMDLELASTRLVPRTNEALRLLFEGLCDNADISGPSLCKLDSRLRPHCLAAWRHARQRVIAEARGMRRTSEAIKDDLAAIRAEGSPTLPRASLCVRAPCSCSSRRRGPRSRLTPATRVSAAASTASAKWRSRRAYRWSMPAR